MYERGHRDRASLQAALQQQRAGQLDDAERAYQGLLRRSPQDVNALHLLGTVHLQRGAFQDAVRYLRQTIELQPRFAVAHANLGVALRSAGDVPGAIRSYRHALELNPADAVTWLNLSIALATLRCLTEALDASERALQLRAESVEAHRQRAYLLTELGRLGEALSTYERALELDPRQSRTLSQYGGVLAELGRTDEAVAALARAATLDPESADVLTNQATALRKAGQPAQARALYERVLQGEPEHLTARLGLVNLLIAEELLPQAQQAAEALVRAHPGATEAHLAVAQAALASRRLLDALYACDRALELREGEPKALATRGYALLQLRQYEEALRSFEQSLEFRPYDAAMHLACAQILLRGGRPVQALAAYQRARELDATLELPTGNLIFARLQLCEWSCLNDDKALIRSGSEKLPIAPFLVLALFDEPALHLASAIRWAKTLASAGSDEARTAASARASAPSIAVRRLRLGYLSADFRAHVVTHALVRLLECHDHSAFELTALSLTHGDGSAARARLIDAMDEHLDLSTLGDAEAAHAIRERGIDVLIDLGGYTDDTRPGILQHRAAPLQLSYLGYPSTMGLEAVDYLICDSFVIPPQSELHYREPLARLPECFMPYDTTRAAPHSAPTRAQQQLPESALVFYSFNASWKIQPRVFSVWMRLLQQLPESVLWLRDGEAVAENLRREAATRGVQAERLVFARREPDAATHLARQSLADLFLDTWPYGAHQTACDALWAGVPVLTYAGCSFASRVAGSLLHAAGVPELVCSDLEQYERRALELARDRMQLERLRTRIRAARDTPLFDMSRLCRHLEHAYLQMWQRQQRGEPPRSFDVEKLF